MNIYFELLDGAVGLKGKYFSAYNTSRIALITGPHLSWTRRAHRIWIEDELGVRYLRNNKIENYPTPVDMQEFTWIKIQCTKI